jgi:hypothetical protein
LNPSQKLDIGGPAIGRALDGAIALQNLAGLRAHEMALNAARLVREASIYAGAHADETKQDRRAVGVLNRLADSIEALALDLVVSQAQADRLRAAVSRLASSADGVGEVQP